MRQQSILSNHLKRPASHISCPFFVISSLINAFLPHVSSSSLSRPLLPHQGHFILIMATSSSPRPHLPHLGQASFLIKATSSSSGPLHTHQGRFFLTKATSSSSMKLLLYQTHFFIKATSSLRPLLPHQDNTFLYTSRQLINAMFFFLHHGHSSPINLPLYTYKCSQTGKDCRHKEK